MVLITKAQFVNDLNAYLQVLANNSKNATGTDVTRSAGEITLSNLTASTTVELLGPNVRGIEVEDYMAKFTRIYSRVRKTDFRLIVQSGTIWNGPPWPTQFIYQYTRKSNIVGSPADASRYVESAAVYNNVTPGATISLSAYRAILTSLQGTLNANFGKFYKNYDYCHSNCYANINTQRVRR